MAKINWFPGHMAKSLKELREQVSKCDYFIETCDSRLPLSSRNPQFKKILQDKKGMLLLTKCDLADPVQIEKWIQYFQSEGHKTVLAVNVLNQSDIKRIYSAIIQDNQAIIQKAKAKGRLIKPIRVMVNGIPNTGKSTLINKLTGKKSVQVSNRPGVTKSLTWLRAGTDFELMDSPGILWPKLETISEQLKLAVSGAIKDDVLPLIEVACGLLMILCQLYTDGMNEKFNMQVEQDEVSTWMKAYEVMEHIAYELNLIKKGNEPDLDRTARRLIIDYRQGKLGTFSLESPDVEIIFPDNM